MTDQNNPNIVKVNEVKEEYEYVQNQICDKCGLKATYKVETQRLVDNRGFYCDDLDCVCTECGHKKTFVFDITTIWESYSKTFGKNN